MGWDDFGVTALVSGVISSLIGIWFKHRAEISIVRAQAELEKEAIRHQIRYGNLHEKRFNFLVAMYPRLVDLGNVCYDYIHADRSNTERAIEELHHQFSSLKIQFEANRILLPSSLDDLIAGVLKDHYLTTKRIRNAERVLLNERDDKRAQKQSEKIDDLFNRLDESLRDVRVKVREEVSKLIGSEEGAEVASTMNGRSLS